MLILRLVLYWDRRQLNAIDGIAVVAITLVVGLTICRLGRAISAGTIIPQYTTRHKPAFFSLWSHRHCLSDRQ